MDGKVLESICKQIYRRFPEVSGSKPRVQTQPLPARGTAKSASNYLLIFRGSGAAEDGRSISRTVRVVTDERGRILKVTTSR
jgi:hypothetical protein